jgi:hypothetical protein
MEPKPPLDAEWKTTIEAKFNSLMAKMAKMESLMESMAEIRAILQNRHHQYLVPIRCSMIHVSTTPTCIIKAPIFKELDSIFVPALATLSSTP